MPYATTQDLIHACGGEERYVQLFDWDADGVADLSVVAKSQELADGRIDAYARKRFATPITSPSSTLRAFAAELAVHDTRKMRGTIGESEMASAEKSQRQWLDDLAAGRISPSDPEPARSPNSTVVIVDNHGIISRASLRGLL